MGKLEMLHVRCPEMVADIFDTGVPDPAHGYPLAAAGALPPDLARAPIFAPPVTQRHRRQHGLQFALVADHRDVFVVHRVLGKHAQVQHGACPARILDDHVGAVQNVWRAAPVRLVQVVDPLTTGCKHRQRALLQRQIHQVEIVAALFDQRTAGVAVEAVPVVHLGVKRLPVFADRYLLHPAHCPRVGHAQHFGHRRHIAVFLRYPDDGRPAQSLLHQFKTVLHPGAQRFFDQDVRVGLERVAQYVDMGMVGGSDHQCVEGCSDQQFPVVVEGLHRVRNQRQGRRTTVGVGIGQRRDLGTVDRLYVLDVFAAHAAATDQCVTKLLHVAGYGLVKRGTGATNHPAAPPWWPPGWRRWAGG